MSDPASRIAAGVSGSATAVKGAAGAAAGKVAAAGKAATGFPLFQWSYGAVWSAVLLLGCAQVLMPDCNLSIMSGFQLSGNEIAELPSIGLWCASTAGVIHAAVALLMLYLSQVGSPLQKKATLAVSCLYFALLAFLEFSHPWTRANFVIEKNSFILLACYAAAASTLIAGTLFDSKAFMELATVEETLPIVPKDAGAAGKDGHNKNMTCVSYTCVPLFAIFLPFLSIYCLCHPDAGLSLFGQSHGQFSSDGEPHPVVHLWAYLLVGSITFGLTSLLTLFFADTAASSHDVTGKRVWAFLALGSLLDIIVWCGGWAHPWSKSAYAENSGDFMHHNLVTYRLVFAWPQPVFWMIFAGVATACYNDSAVMGRTKAKDGWRKML